MSAKENISEVLKRHTPELMSIHGVIGTGEGRKKERPCILVFVVKKTSEISRKIPKTIDGYPVVIQQTGNVKALNAR